MSKEIICNEKDYMKRSIILNRTTLETHIYINHPEMYGNEKEIINTIKNPECVLQSKREERTEVFFSRESTSTYPNAYITVHVKYENKNLGCVTTARFSKVLQGGEILYVKGKL